MDHIVKFLLSCLRFFIVFSLVGADTYSVKIRTNQHINVVDNKFLSFTVDPKYLFSSNEKYNSKECICMASSLTPAYIRIAGPSTSYMTFHNATISIDDLDPVEMALKEEDKGPKKFRFDDLVAQLESTSTKFKRSDTQGVAVTHKQWKKFVQWAKSTGFDLIFALNNNEKTASGMWDPNTALNVLTEAEKANIGEIFWELGYECNNQSIEEYLNDLETLKVITETFSPGEEGKWRVVGGDITKCLHADSKSDFKDYVILSNDMMDAIMLNGNSSSHEISRMSDTDRLKLLKILSHSSTPLWLTEKTQRRYNELERAADWMTSLGYSAKNGFSVHFRELVEEELYEPTLSFYMALLFKNLVGEKVLDVEMEAEQAMLFAHCTSLRRKPVPGAVTIYGVNLDDEPARMSLKLSKRGEDGDIMQFILGLDLSGNVAVNGRAMYYEGDIRPVVRRVRPYKTLLLNLPAKSFGFWVLTNTKIEACYHTEELKVNKKKFIETKPVDNYNHQENVTDKNIKDVVEQNGVKVDDHSKNIEISDEPQIAFDNNQIFRQTKTNDAFDEKVEDINDGLENVRRLLETKAHKRKENSVTKTSRPKRQLLHEENENDGHKIIGRHGLRSKSDKKRLHKQETGSKLGLIKKFLHYNAKLNGTKSFRNGKLIKVHKMNKNRVSKRELKPKKKTVQSSEKIPLDTRIITRNRRSVLNENRDTYNKENDKISENEIDRDSKQNMKLGKLLRKLHKHFLDMPIEMLEDENVDDINIDEEPLNAFDDDVDDDGDNDVQNKSTNDDDSLEFSEGDHGFIKSTLKKLLSVLGELNKNLNKFWNVFTILE